MKFRREHDWVPEVQSSTCKVNFCHLCSYLDLFTNTIHTSRQNAEITHFQLFTDAFINLSRTSWKWFYLHFFLHYSMCFRLFSETVSLSVCSCFADSLKGKVLSGNRKWTSVQCVRFNTTVDAFPTEFIIMWRYIINCPKLQGEKSPPS